MTDNNSDYSDCPPQFTTKPEHQAVLKELIQREPLFHHPEFGRNKEDFEAMTDLDFWEVGASGRRYSREYVISGVVKRYEDPQYEGVNSPPENNWKTEDFYCREIALNTYLLTYTLVQEERITRRATLWQKCSDNWKILYHQGTVVQEPSG